MAKLLVLDFDCTLAADEIGYWHASVNMCDRGFGGKHRVSLLRSLFDRLREHGILLAICSDNSEAVIKRALAAPGVVLHRFFTPEMILGRETVEDGFLHDGSILRKSQVIATRLLRPLAILPSELLFVLVDDSASQARDITSSLPGAKTCLVARAAPVRIGRSNSYPAGGIHEEECDAILHWAGIVDSESSRLKLALPPRESIITSIAPVPLKQAGLPAKIQGDIGGGKAACDCFKPKRTNGPLSRRCLHCRFHQMDHLHS